MSLVSRLALAMSLVAGCSSAAFAADTTAPVQVSSSVTSSCLIEGVGDVDFGTYDPVGRNSYLTQAKQSSMSLRCNGGTTARIQISEGLNRGQMSGCSAPVRRLKAGNNTYMDYRFLVKQTSGATAVIGCAANAQYSVTFTSLETKGINFQSELPAGQAAPVGDYADTLTVRVFF